LIAEANASGEVQVEYAYLDGEPLALWREDETPTVPGVVAPIAPIGSTDTASPTYSWEPLQDAIEYHFFVYDRVVRERVFDERLPSSEVCSETTCAHQSQKQRWMGALGRFNTV